MAYKKFESEVRPWGSWQIVDVGQGNVEKIVVVNPTGVLSLQSHNHRSELWTILSGSAEVTIDDQVINLRPGEKIFIPQGAKHRIANRGDIFLVFHEYQMGQILDENDIVRYDDIYGRK